MMGPQLKVLVDALLPALAHCAQRYTVFDGGNTWIVAESAVIDGHVFDVRIAPGAGEFQVPGPVAAAPPAPPVEEEEQVPAPPEPAKGEAQGHRFELRRTNWPAGKSVEVLLIPQRLRVTAQDLPDIAEVLMNAPDFMDFIHRQLRGADHSQLGQDIMGAYFGSKVG